MACPVTSGICFCTGACRKDDPKWQIFRPFTEPILPFPYPDPYSQLNRPPTQTVTTLDIQLPWQMRGLSRPYARKKAN